MNDKIIISDLHMQVVIGVNNNERSIKQNIIVNIIAFVDVSRCGETDSITDTLSYRCGF